MALVLWSGRGATVSRSCRQFNISHSARRHAEIADPMAVATHAKASEVSDLNMVHSGMDLIPLGSTFPEDQAAAKVYVELHKMDDVVGPDSLFLLAYGWADAQGNWDAAFTKYKRLKAQAVVPVFESLQRPTRFQMQRPVSIGSPNEVVTSLCRAMWCLRPDVTQAVSKRSRLTALSPRSMRLSNWATGGHMHDHLALATTNEQSTILNVLVPMATWRG